MRNSAIFAAGAVVSLAGAAQAQIVDGSFEGGTPNAAWIETSTNFGTPLCNGECLGPGSPTAARTGIWWAWFGGIDTAVEAGTLTQTVNIPAGSPTLQFYLVGFADPSNPANDYLKVFVGTTEVFSITDTELSDPNNPYTLDWTLVSIPLAAFAGTTRTIRFDSVTNGGGFLTNIWVDDVSIVGGPATCYANCDNSTTAPVLNVGDFTCFLQRFAAGDSYANCDNSTTAPVLNVGDFTCFLQRFAAGCP
jgi:hypothetical protein